MCERVWNSLLYMMWIDVREEGTYHVVQCCRFYQSRELTVAWEMTVSFAEIHIQVSRLLLDAFGAFVNQALL